jgi:hypothetical protein
LSFPSFFSVLTFDFLVACRVCAGFDIFLFMVYANPRNKN